VKDILLVMIALVRLLAAGPNPAVPAVRNPAALASRPVAPAVGLIRRAVLVVPAEEARPVVLAVGKARLAALAAEEARPVVLAVGKARLAALAAEEARLAALVGPNPAAPVCTVRSESPIQGVCRLAAGGRPSLK